MEATAERKHRRESFLLHIQRPSDVLEGGPPTKQNEIRLEAFRTLFGLVSLSDQISQL